jgi:hypothetical protein
MPDDLAHLLAHPLRQLLLVEYDRTTSPSKAARQLNQPVNLVSYHTDVLLRSGWIESVRTERRRGATEHFYRTTGPRVIEDVEWTTLPLRRRRAIVLATLSATTEDAKQAALAGGFDEAAAHLSRCLLELDEQGVADVAATLREVIDRVHEIAAASPRRGPASCRPHELVIQYFSRPPRT